MSTENDQRSLDGYTEEETEESSSVDDIDFSEFERHLRLEHSLGDRTVGHHRRMARKFIEFTDHSEPSRDDLLDYKEALMQEDYSPSHINNSLKAAEYLLAFLGTDAEISKLPRREKRPDPLTDEQASAIIAAAKTYRDTAIIRTLVSTGLRATELVELELRDLDLDDRVIHVREGKGKKERDVFLTEDARGAIDRYLSRRPEVTSDALFLSERNQALTRSGLYQLVERTAERADLDRDVSPHVFRHTYASRLSQNGASTATVQALMGHSDVRSTMNYIHQDREQLKEHHQRYLESSDESF